MTGYHDSTPVVGDAASVAPPPTTVKVDIRGPLNFGLSAHGGSSEDAFAALIAATRELVAAGLIGQATTESEAA
ncbi:MAG: hypothetical protein DYG90_05640 [Chloroflexi bacterium CFX6]|nr:hypothetical protein [Chloroflexi bacterium CFX6]